MIAGWSRHGNHTHMKRIRNTFLLAKLWVPFQSVNVKQHGSAGVGHICAVDSARLAAGQTLQDANHTHTHRSASNKMSPASGRQLWSGLSYPDEPGVHGAEHGAVRHHCIADLVHVVHQPPELHRAEVSADGEPGFMLQGDEDTPTIDIRQKHMRKKAKPTRDEELTFKWFLFLPGVLLIRRSTVDWVRRSNHTEQKHCSYFIES